MGSRTFTDSSVPTFWEEWPGFVKKEEKGSSWAKVFSVIQCFGGDPHVGSLFDQRFQEPGSLG